MVEGSYVALTLGRVFAKSSPIKNIAHQTLPELNKDQKTPKQIISNI